MAVTAVLQGAEASLLVVEQGPDEAWLDCRGRRHVAELSIPFLRRNHLWANRRGDSIAPHAGNEVDA